MWFTTRLLKPPNWRNWARYIVKLPARASRFSPGAAWVTTSTEESKAAVATKGSRVNVEATGFVQST